MAYGRKSLAMYSRHPSILKLLLFLDHTKYIGKSSAHPVSRVVQWHGVGANRYGIQLNVKFSEDGEDLTEGEEPGEGVP